MPLNCPLCHRVNPDEALFCCHDGAALGYGSRSAGPIAVGAQPFLNPFVFPTGRFCRTFDELVLACEAHWDEARDLLREGLLESFLSGLGRTDLSWAAHRAAAAPDPDLGLDELLGQLPGGVRKPARLAVQPTEINVGRVGRGTDHRVVVRLLNEGMGLIRGSVACSGPDWLALGEDGAAPDKIFQFRSDQAVSVRVIGKRLRAGFRTPEGRLVIDSNGGSVVVLVRVEPPAVVRFAHGVLAGADSPRRLAEMTRASPREAAVYFENGAVAAWYAVNGWTYPVQGPPAAGVAALQQFYEALGLAAPPRVELDHHTLRLEGTPGATLETAVVLQTSERRAVFAHATTAEPWLRIDRAVLGGRTARIPVRVPHVPDRPGEVLRGRVQVTANGNQRFAVEVTLAVRRAGGVIPLDDDRAGKAPPTMRPRRVPEEILEALPARRVSGRPGLMAWLLVGSFLLLAAAAAVVVTAIVLLTPPGGVETPAAATPVAQAPPDAPKTDPIAPQPDHDPPKNPPSPPPAPAPPPPPEPSEIAAALKGDDPDARRSALKQLAALGPKAAPALHALPRAMKDGDADFRREALAALPKIGSPTAADVDVLAELADDAAFPDGRKYALAALASLGTDARPAATALCHALKDPDPAVKRQAADVLGGLGPAVRDAAREALVNALHDADPDVGASAAAALAKMGPPTKADDTDLLLSLTDKAEAARRYALASLRDLGPDAADFAPYLREAVTGDASPELRRLAVSALLAVSPDAPNSIDAFGKAVADADPEVRRSAVEALVKVGPGHGALPGLIRALGSDDEATATAAGAALKAAHLSAKQIAELGDVLEEGKAPLRLRVMALLKPLGADAAPAVPGVCEVLKGGPGEGRRQAFALLAAMGPAARKADGALEALLDDDKFAVRLDAATTLAAVAGPDAGDAIPVLLEGLRVDQLDDAEQMAERDRAIEALGRIGEPAIKPLVDALENDFTGGGLHSVKGQINVEARLAAVKALEAMGPAADTFKALAELTNLQRIDPSRAVREAAKEARARIRRSGGA